MKQTVIIPTDFTVSSLHILKKLLQDSPADVKYSIILLHGTRLSSSITDLMFFNRSSLIEKLSSQSFEDALDVLKNKYQSKLVNIRKELFSGFNQNAFENLLDANGVDAIYVSETYEFKAPSGKSFDLMPFIAKTKCPVFHIDWKRAEERVPETGKVAEIFLNDVSVA